MTIKGKLIILILLLTTICFGALYGSKQLFKNEVTVNYQNINYLAVYKTSSLDKEDPEPLVEIEYSGQVIKLASGEYSFYYEGKKGYDSKYVEKSITEDSVVDLRADYSKEAKQLLVNKELPAIKSLLAKKYPRLGLYKLTEAKLYENGEWFGGLLEYQGDDVLNGDDIRFILHKTSGSWVIITDPPTIMISKKDYKDSNIPGSVIDGVNEL